MLSWVSHDEEEIELENLTNAFVAYSNDYLEGVIVPANVAIESALRSLLQEYMKQHIGMKKAREFLEEAATYSRQLKVLLPPDY